MFNICHCCLEYFTFSVLLLIRLNRGNHLLVHAQMQFNFQWIITIYLHCVTLLSYVYSISTSGVAGKRRYILSTRYRFFFSKSFLSSSITPEIFIFGKQIRVQKEFSTIVYPGFAQGFCYVTFKAESSVEIYSTKYSKPKVIQQE